MIWLRLDHASDMRYHHEFVGRVPNFNWNRDNRQALLGWRDSDDRDDYCGVRPVARVSVALLGILFYPSAEHAADFAYHALRLEYSCFVCRLQLKKQT